MNGQPWGFTVSHDTSDDTWRVSLPHQCDRWQVSDNPWGDDNDQQQATACLMSFIREALVAYAALAAGDEFGVDG